MGINCKICEELFHYKNELVFLLGGVIVPIDEKYPDWDVAFCVRCAGERGLI